MARLLKFDKLGRFYILALSTIALSIILSQVVIQNYIGKQQNDSRTINVAGRQRMLSQKISKLVQQFETQNDSTDIIENLNALDRTLELWVRSHSALLYGDEEIEVPGTQSGKIIAMYEAINAHYKAIVKSSKTILTKLKQNPKNNISSDIKEILNHDEAFLQGMDDIVFEYDKEARAKVARLKNIEIGLLILSLSIIVIEFIFIFRPLALNVKLTVRELVDSEEKSVKMAEELSRLYEELVKSYQELESLEIETEPQQVYATIDKEGNFKSIAPVFHKLLYEEASAFSSDLNTLLTKNDYSEQFIADLFALLKAGHPWHGELKLIDVEGDFCWLEMSVIPVNLYQKKEYKIIGKNVTEIKEARIRSREINRSKVEKQVREQQYRSVLILEGQEEERRRLGREMHDGIGQMLTALKLSIESITPTNSIHTKKRLQDTKSLMKSILQEVRRISFNLTPASLSDFGIVPAVKKFCQEVNNISVPEIKFNNKTNFFNRLEPHIESNLYRIVQEGVNNAIKYAKAKHIIIEFEHSAVSLQISIKDDGKGFNYSNLIKSGHFKSAGHGIFNMKERSAFINAAFVLSSAVGAGTEITINLPLE